MGAYDDKENLVRKVLEIYKGWVYRNPDKIKPSVSEVGHTIQRTKNGRKWHEDKTTAIHNHVYCVTAATLRVRSRSGKRLWT